MEKEGFIRTVGVFNQILIEHLRGAVDFKILHNYVKSYHNGKYISLGFYSAGDTTDLIISYDEFFQTPVLYYRVNGTVENHNPHCVVDIHPLLESPYIYVHPCETKSLMESIKATTMLETLISWFGIFIELVNPTIQLRVPQNIINQYNEII